MVEENYTKTGEITPIYKSPHRKRTIRGFQKWCNFPCFVQKIPLYHSPPHYRPFSSFYHTNHPRLITPQLFGLILLYSSSLSQSCLTITNKIGIYRVFHIHLTPVLLSAYNIFFISALHGLCNTNVDASGFFRCSSILSGKRGLLYNILIWHNLHIRGKAFQFFFCPEKK